MSPKTSLDPVEGADQAGRSLVVAMIAACRPKQWAKNVLVFVAPAAAGVLNEPYRIRLTVLGFIAFCLVSSATYLLNDVLDVESDRRHPTKRFRPIASGDLPVGLAITMSVVLFLAGVLVAWSDNTSLVLVVVLYAALTTAYSFIFKKITILDLVILSSGFILRLLAGAYAAEVDVSDWFLLISLFGSMFIAAAKRYAEKQELGDRAAELRPTLGVYSLGYLSFIRNVSVAALVMSYCLWAVERANVAAASPWIQLSVIPFLIAVLRYALLVDQGKGSAPEDVILHDSQMQIMGLLWVVTLVLGVYL